MTSGSIASSVSPEDIDECQTDRCHADAACYNGEGSFTCQCKPGYYGDGFLCTPGTLMLTCPGVSFCWCHSEVVKDANGSFSLSSIHVFSDCDPATPQAASAEPDEWWVCAAERTAQICDLNLPVRPERTKTRCESHRESLLAVTQFGPQGPRPPVGQYIPVCDDSGAYEPMQCHGSTGYCWCVDRIGQEISGTRSEPGSRPMCEEPTGFSDQRSSTLACAMAR